MTRWRVRFWSMTTTLLGFLSLLVASAKPLRELGIAGAIGTLTAIAVAYSVYPVFLGRWASVKGRRECLESIAFPAGRNVVVGIAAAIVLFLGVGTLRVDTDPGLLTYFAEGTELRDGLERIDADGGSSTLDIIVRDSEGERLDSDIVFQKMQGIQAALEADSAVGVVLGPSVLLEHARTLPLGRFMSLQILLDMASNPQLGSVGLGYVSPERDEGHFFLRMRESVDESSRDVVTDRLRSLTREAGMEPVLVGGLYDLQAQLSKLIASSLKIGIGGLLLLFLAVAMLVSRSLATTVRMWFLPRRNPARGARHIRPLRHRHRHHHFTCGERHTRDGRRLDDPSRRSRAAAIERGSRGALGCGVGPDSGAGARSDRHHLRRLRHLRAVLLPANAKVRVGGDSGHGDGSNDGAGGAAAARFAGNCWCVTSNDCIADFSDGCLGDVLERFACLWTSSPVRLHGSGCHRDLLDARSGDQRRSLHAAERRTGHGLLEMEAEAIIADI